MDFQNVIDNMDIDNKVAVGHELEEKTPTLKQLLKSEMKKGKG